MRGRNIETFKAKLDHAEACPHTAAESNLTDAFQRPQSSIDANVTLKVLKGSYALSLDMQRPPKPTARTHRAPVHQSRRDLKEISEGVARKFHYQKANTMKFLQALLGLCHWKAEFLPIKRNPPDAAFDQRLPFVNGSFRPKAASRERLQSIQSALWISIESPRIKWKKNGTLACLALHARISVLHHPNTDSMSASKRSYKVSAVSTTFDIVLCGLDFKYVGRYKRGCI